MAEKKEHSMIGFNKSTMAFISLVVALIYFGVFFKDRGGDQATAAAAHDFTVQSLQTRLAGDETRITTAESNIVKVAERQAKFEKDTIDKFNASEKRDIALMKDQQAILTGQQDTKSRLDKFADLQIKQIESNAEIKAWIKSIDNVKVD